MAENLLILGAGVLLGVLATALIRLVLRWVLAPQLPKLAVALGERCGRPLAVLMPLLGFYAALPFVAGAAEFRGYAAVHKLTMILLIVVFAWLLVQIVAVLQQVVLSREIADDTDNLQARKLETQFRMLRRFLDVLIVLIAVAAILLQFDGFRQFGRGLLASAGIASIVLGLAAQKTLGNLIAGFQIAITQPIRLDDVVVVEDEWGRVEEITLAYVVVRIWDDRRLILPLSYFIERPFTNWTRTKSEILGTVFLHVDYTAPIADLRSELGRAVADHPDWDGRVAEIIAFEARRDTLELRALVSARDSAAAWRLRCHVREALVSFLQREHPGALPKRRAELHEPRHGAD